MANKLQVRLNEMDLTENVTDFQWSKEYVPKAALGLYDDGKVLVCGHAPTVGEDRVPVDVPGKCGVCSTDVWIRREHVSLFGGKEEPPAIRCSECRAKEDPKTWFPRQGDWTMEFVTNTDALKTLLQQEQAMLKKFATAGHRFSEELKKFKSVMDDAEALSDRISYCQACGDQVRKSGRNFCSKCQRRQWRRS